METVELQLKEIHLPELITWWPPAIGWWLLLIIIPLVIGGLFWLYRRMTRKTATKSAKKILNQIKQQSLSDEETVKQLSALLRRVAMSVAPRDEIASLTGSAWLSYLDASMTDKPFSLGVGSIFSQGHYQQQLPNNVDIQSLMNVCEQWLTVQKTT